MKPILSAALGFALALAALPPAASAENRTAHQIVFELTAPSPEAWNAVLNNIENVRAALGEQRTRVAVIVHGKGIGFLKKENAELTARMQKLAQSQVTFAACENTMKRLKVPKEDLLPFAVTVDSGVAEVVRKQEAGWTYVRSGG